MFCFLKWWHELFEGGGTKREEMERVLIALQFVIKVCQMVDTQMWRRGSDTHVQNMMTHQTMLALGRWWSCYFVVLVHLYFMQSRPKQSASLFNDVDTIGQPWWSCKSEAARNELNRFHIDIYIMMSVCLFVCNEKSSLPPGSLLWPPELSITTLYNSGLVLMVLDWFFMVPFRFL